MTSTQASQVAHNTGQIVAHQEKSELTGSYLTKPGLGLRHTRIEFPIRDGVPDRVHEGNGVSAPVGKMPEAHEPPLLLRLWRNVALDDLLGL